jgi:hypothetical protein
MLFNLSINLQRSIDISIETYKIQLLEATARAVQPVLEWGESGLAVADGLSNLLKVNIYPTIKILDQVRFKAECKFVMNSGIESSCA